jgi:hypothetical protein
MYLRVEDTGNIHAQCLDIMLLPLLVLASLTLVSPPLHTRVVDLSTMYAYGTGIFF